MINVCNYFFKDQLNKKSTDELKVLHGHYVCDKSSACMSRIFTIASIALSILSLLSNYTVAGLIFSAIAIGLGVNDFIKCYKVSLIEKLLQERGIQATHKIDNWGWKGFSFIN